MKSYALFQEYIWLVETIHKEGRLTLGEINERWIKTEMSEGVSIARSTFNRHRDAILDMFGIIIECDKKDGFRYFIDNDYVLEEDSIQNWMFSTLSVNSVLAESKGLNERILLERIPSDGENLHKFIDAMKRGVRIKVKYRRYGAEEPKSSMKVDPYFVRFFNKRWYGLVKFPEPTGQLFALAFDRIVSLEVTDEHFEYPKDFEPADWFRDCYGIVRDPDVPVEKGVWRRQLSTRWNRPCSMAVILPRQRISFLISIPVVRLLCSSMKCVRSMHSCMNSTQTLMSSGVQMTTIRLGKMRKLSFLPQESIISSCLMK